MRTPTIGPVNSDTSVVNLPKYKAGRPRLWTAAAVVALSLVSAGLFAAEQKNTSPEPKRSAAIKYINSEVPKLTLPDYKGVRYQAEVPDTLDLADRAALAVNGLTEPTDPDADYELYWVAVFANNPPFMFHDFNDHVQIKFRESLPLDRIASGSRQNMEVELRWLEQTVQMQGPNGVLYYPKVGRPWFKDAVPVEQFGALPEGDHYSEPYVDGRTLGAVAAYYKLTGDERWKKVGQRIVDGLTTQVVDKGDWAYFPKGIYGVNEAADPNAPLPDDPWSRVPAGWIVMGLAQFYQATGYQPALTLSGKLARYVRYHGNAFDPDGHYINIGMHFHGHLYPLLGMLEYAIAANDWEMIQFVRKGYEFGTANMNTLVGYVPEWIDTKNYQTSEICGVADIIALAVKLTRAGAGDYWDDVDRWTRNEFAEGQLTSSDWVYQMVKDKPVKLKQHTEYLSTDKVPERCVGGFAGWPSANDWSGKGGITSGCSGIMHCCTGNGTRTIYYVWENILNYDHGKLKVNLLMNRASPWADVDSFIPYEGRVDVKIKAPCDLSIRIPEWVVPSQTRCEVNGQGRALSWDGRYAVVGKVGPKDGMVRERGLAPSRASASARKTRLGEVPVPVLEPCPKDVVVLTFPIYERTDVVKIQGKDYTLIRKGNDVVHIDPPGKNCPFYQRDPYRENKTRFRKVERFVSDNLLDW